MAGESSSRVVRFILTGDSAGALKAQKEVEEGFEGTGTSADKADKHIGIFHKSLEGIKGVIGYGAGILGLSAFAFGIKDVISAGKQWQEQQISLKNALKDTGQAGTSQINAVNKAVEHTATHGGFTPVEEVAGITQLIRAYGSATTAVKVNKDAVDLARGAHLEYSKALGILAKAQAGTAGKAQQYLGIIQPVKTWVDQLTEAQKKLNPELLREAELRDKQATALEINRRIQEHYAGATVQYSKTASGAWSNFKHILDLIMEKVGAALLPLLEKLGQILGKAGEWIIKNWKGIGSAIGEAFNTIIHVVKGLGIPTITTFVGTFLALKIAIMGAAIATGIYDAALAAINWAGAAAGIYTVEAAGVALNATMTATPWGAIITAIAALVAGLVYAYIHVKAFREVVQTSFGAIKTVVSDVVSFIGKHWELFLYTFSAGLAAPAVFVIQHFKEIKSGIVDVFNGVKGFVEGVWHEIAEVIEGGVNTAIKIINGLIKAYDFVANLTGLPQVGTIGEVHILSQPHAARRLSPQERSERELEREGRRLGTSGGLYGALPGSTAREVPTRGAPTGFGPPLAPPMEVHFNLDGHKFARALVRNPRGRRELAEGVTLETLQRQARK